MGLSKVPTAKMGILYGMIGMTCLITAFWADNTYTYNHGIYTIAISMAPGIIVGIISAISVQITSLPQLVGAYNGFGGLAAALEAIGLYFDPNAVYHNRGGVNIASKDNAFLIVQGIALILSIFIGMMTFTGSMIAVLKLNGNIASKARVIPFRWSVTLIILIGIIVSSVIAFTGGETPWNDKTVGLICIMVATGLSGMYGVIAVMAIGVCLLFATFS